MFGAKPREQHLFRNDPEHCAAITGTHSMHLDNVRDLAKTLQSAVTCKEDELVIRSSNDFRPTRKQLSKMLQSAPTNLPQCIDS